MGGWGGCRSHPLPAPHNIRHCSLLPQHPAPQFGGVPILGKRSARLVPCAAPGGGEGGSTVPGMGGTLMPSHGNGAWECFERPPLQFLGRGSGTHTQPAAANSTPGAAAAPGTDTLLPCTTAPGHRDPPPGAAAHPRKAHSLSTPPPPPRDYAQSWGANSSWGTLGKAPPPHCYLCLGGPEPSSTVSAMVSVPLCCASPVLWAPSGVRTKFLGGGGGLGVMPAHPPSARNGHLLPSCSPPPSGLVDTPSDVQLPPHPAPCRAPPRSTRCPYLCHPGGLGVTRLPQARLCSAPKRK